VDEAHAMPPETLEELRLLYNLQVGNAKLLQIVLFGQPELNAKLDRPNMRQLKDRIVHHFNMQPLSRNILESYLMFRMRAAGYHGPNIFSPNAIKLIASASNGLMRRVNILADKSLLAAFVDDTHNIETRHVQAAMRDSELNTAPKWSGNKLLWGSAAAALLLFGMAAWLMLHKQQIPVQPSREKPLAQNQSPEKPSPIVAPSAVIAQPLTAQATGSPAPASAGVAKKTEPAPQKSAQSKPENQQFSLFDQRLTAGKQLLEQKKAVASIQLFYNVEIKQARIEGFLKRADALGVLPEIYLLPAKISGKDGLRVVYGAYPSVQAAHNAFKDLPARYQEAFATSTYIF
jgi:MSHA biogenesis protein MshM